MSKKNNELIESVQKDEAPERNVIQEEQDILNEEADLPPKPSMQHREDRQMQHREDRPLGTSTPLEDRMLCLQKHLEVCKQSLDASRIPDLETELADITPSGIDRSSAVVASLTNAEGSTWTPNCLSNGSSLRGDGDGTEQSPTYDCSAPFSCRAVTKELPSPIRRTTEAFRLAQGLAV
jgi:hypothetical protein